MNEYELQDLAYAMGREAVENDDVAQPSCPFRAADLVEAFLQGYDDGLSALAAAIVNH